MGDQTTIPWSGMAVLVVTVFPRLTIVQFSRRLSVNSRLKYNSWNLSEDFDWCPIGEACMVDYSFHGSGIAKGSTSECHSRWSGTRPHVSTLSSTSKNMLYKELPPSNQLPSGQNTMRLPTESDWLLPCYNPSAFVPTQAKVSSPDGHHAGMSKEVEVRVRPWSTKCSVIPGEGITINHPIMPFTDHVSIPNGIPFSQLGLVT